MSRGNGHKPLTPESIYFNPFAEDRQTTTAIDVSYLSDSHHRPAVRRRGSGSDSIATTSSASSSSGLSVFANTPRHLRVKTDGPVGVMASGGHHPLRSADLSSSFRNGAGITRPQLTRIVNIPPLVDAPPAEPAADEKVVLVHEVTSKDSLAGVSLKYGISMADLRRANHLWSSDPIHLRKILYIPLDKTSRKAIDPPPLLVSTEEMEQAASLPTWADTMGPGSMSTIRRVPVSQLSFFPPHARPQEPDPPPPTDVPPRTKHPHSRHTRYATTPAASPLPGTASSPSLTSILSALPIQPSTRDTIIARLSYDSTSSTGHSDDGEGHELDDVRRGASLDSIFPSNEATPRVRAPAAGPGPSASTFNRSHARTASGSLAYRGGGAQYRRAGPPRTVQLEPSPAMQLPFGTLGRKGRAGTSGDSDFDLLGLRDGEGEGDTEDLDP
ncbi:peptidoglycan-binding LysM domain protein [Mycena olivaceomarginata]|nr:peptidoglycan-binding LysM domain protein [Mycena olivaceomarginata]